MDDILYFLLLIGWLAFSFYQQSAKKKRKAEEERAAARRSQQEEEGAEYDERETVAERTGEEKPDFRKTLEEILLGEELTKEEKETQREQEPIETTSAEEEDRANKYQRYYNREISDKSHWYDKEKESPEKLEGKIEELEKDMVLKEEDTVTELDDESEIKNEQYFNLRKAVIYSEILNAKYVN